MVALTLYELGRERNPEPLDHPRLCSCLNVPKLIVDLCFKHSFKSQAWTFVSNTLSLVEHSGGSGLTGQDGMRVAEEDPGHQGLRTWGLNVGTCFYLNLALSHMTHLWGLRSKPMGGPACVSFC